MTSTNPYPATSGDANDERIVTLGGTADLATVSSIRALVQSKADPSVSSVLSASVLNATARTVTVVFGSWLATAAAGGYWLEVETTWSDGTILTFPQGRPDSLQVFADLGA